MFLDASAAAQDYWLQQIHVMAHRVERVPYAVQLNGAAVTSVGEIVGDNATHPFRTDLDQRRAEFKRRWLQPR
jgi:hypothetical protein